MKTKTIIMLILVSALILPATAQGNTDGIKRHAIHGELFGWGIFYSLNYEYRIPKQENKTFTLGGGITSYSIFNEKTELIALSAGYLKGERHMLETGLTPVFGFTNEDKSFHLAPRIGYRLETPNGIIIRAGLSPFLKIYDEFGIVPHGHLSIGKSFLSRKAKKGR